jgi:hypothetical protein
MKCVFREEMNSVYSGKKLIVLIQGRNEVFIQGRNELCLFRETMNIVYSGKK